MPGLKEANFVILTFWNDFAVKNGYPPIPRLTDRIKRQIRKRLLAEPDFLRRMPGYFDLIKKYTSGKDVFGNPPSIFTFLRATTTLKALNLRETKKWIG